MCFIVGNLHFPLHNYLFQIINLIPEYKTIIFKSKRSQPIWFLPTTYAVYLCSLLCLHVYSSPLFILTACNQHFCTFASQYSVFTCADGELQSLKKSLSRLREFYMSDIRRCEQFTHHYPCWLFFLLP